MLANYHADNIPTRFSHPLVDEAKDSLMNAVSYLDAKERADVLRACHFGDMAHIKDKRKSGEPYITHPIAVAEILAGFLLDRDSIIAAILHDTVEDTEVTDELVASEFGETVARLVDGVTKLKSGNMSKQQSQAATFHKILNATLIDPRVLIIKLSDRLHNMSTMDAVREEKQKSTARETLDFYVPFARIMGLNDIADYIELLCYRNLNPVMYNKFNDKLLQHGLGRNFQKIEISTYLQNLLGHLNLKGHVQVLDNRTSMYRQFFKNRGQANRLIRQYDFEVVLEDIGACDKLAYHLIQKFEIADRNIQDNIRKPLAGGNQSLSLIYKKDYNFIKVTLMTARMKEASRLGVLGNSKNDISQSVIQASLRNMKDLAAVEGEDAETSLKVINELMSYLHERKIVCYSPQGRAYELPRGATALDFAYAVGPAVGNIATGADINGEHGKLGLVLADGDTVSIDIDKNATPKADWLGFVATNKARNEILKFLKRLPHDQKEHYGKEALMRALKPYDKTLDDLSEQDWADILAWRGVASQSDIFLQIATGTLLPQLVVSRLFSEEVDVADGAEITQTKHLLAGIKGVEITFAKCCNPMYGDSIVGHLSARQGLTVHRHKCYSLENIRVENPYQVIQLNWKSDIKLDHTNSVGQLHFPATLKIHAMLNEEQMSQAIYELRDLNIGIEQTSVKADEKSGGGVGATFIQVVVRSRAHLEEGIMKLRQVLGYPSIMRLYQMPT
ncbi:MULTISPECIES: bifunctional (p)ppGpp synthetase/guanosine-3',5'-bis(diphosphate) 3'-pyrophosphohydrolase [Moraxella]|uniref:GTP pyrophosphokinase n=1 Tax=Moraxella lacunata TaxID=477 RepID=A0A1B8PYG3_MORLA|nr:MULTISPECIES: HD domain-containing protein [Moraxella]MBE9587913.1 bifunctional (p)ppGpp synthetase/guanosine-3',5'-bis(diphosphate) 3'-pyrophosphohydrolase [Moraxella sp. K1630]MBE9596142.1 bifunctional (p)ppGpp synthetase/guanosine-3',5'-bis(diphosphate) 3'-pyrophosphohydrolase [Moraxella sp. K2450]MDH9218487.1 HD domain-containing protein [Moraxella lacunata]MDI4482902.1 bifunctional (p)ppGpp synthetase/guanosine-3',5'-bis(diphosphate) 3'-pyrophosphohydrolase [Moraxella lacunata]MDI45080